MFDLHVFNFMMYACISLARQKLQTDNDQYDNYPSFIAPHFFHSLYCLAVILEF